MIKAYKIEIKLTEEQKLKVNKTIGTCRFIYNLYLQKNKEEYEKNKKFISGFDFSKWLNNDFIKQNPSHSWIKDVSSKAVKQSIMNGDKAFKSFST
jgi:putative transposase